MSIKDAAHGRARSISSRRRAGEPATVRSASYRARSKRRSTTAALGGGAAGRGKRDQCRGRDGQRLALGERRERGRHTTTSPPNTAARRPDHPVADCPADDAIDVVQAVAQDRDADRHRDDGTGEDVDRQAVPADGPIREDRFPGRDAERRAPTGSAPGRTISSAGARRGPPTRYRKTIDKPRPTRGISEKTARIGAIGRPPGGPARSRTGCRGSEPVAGGPVG